MTSTMGVREWAVLILTAMLFASSFAFHHVAVQSVPPVTVAAARALLALPVALAILRLAGGRLPPMGPQWLPLLVLGFVGAALPFVAVAWGQVHITSGLAGILYGTIPLFTVVFAHFWTVDERLRRRRALGVAIGFAGVVMIFGPGALAGLADQLLGTGITLCAAVAYALANVYARRLSHLTPTVLAAGQLACASAILVPLSLAIDAPWRLSPPASALWSVAGVALLATALPLVPRYWLIRTVGATNTSLLSFFMPFLAVGIGALFLGETLSISAAAGLLAIVAGAALVGGRYAESPRTSAME